MYWVELLASYEGEMNEPEVNEPEVNEPEGNEPDPTRTFTQDDVNRFLAEDRRKTEAKYKDKVDKLEQSYKAALENKSLSETERQELETQLEDLRARHRTKEQQMAHERKIEQQKYEEDLNQWKEKATTWESRYTESTINRELQAAAVEHDAYNPELVMVHLKGATRLEEQMDEEGNPTGSLVPMVTMTVKNDDTGAQENLKMTPSEAVEYMKKNPERYGGFFKNNIREGIGASSATGGAMSGDGTVDVTKLTDEQYFKLREQNPAALGLTHLKPRR